MRNLLFPLLGKGPVFGGGGGGGGGGGDSDSGGGMSVTASTKSSGGGGYTSIRDMFDGGGAGKSGDTFGGALGGISNAIGASPVGSGGGGGGGSDNDRSDPAPAAPPPASPPPAAPGTIAGFGQDYNDDGRITIGEVFTDMTDAGGAGGSGGVYSGGPLAGISNVVTGQFNPGIQDMLDGGGPGQSGPQFEGSLVGNVANAVGLPPLGAGSGVVSGAVDQIEELFPSTGYTSVGDLFDGGGPGQSGSEFGGLLGGISNTVGLTPRDPGPGAGAVYEGPNIDGSSGYLQDPGQMTVDPSTGFITADENEFRPAPVLETVMSGRNEPGSVFDQTSAAPPPPAPPPPPVAARVEPPPVSMGFLPPQMSMVGFEDVMSPTGSGSVAFDNYFMPPAIPQPQPPAPIAPMPVSDRFGMPLALSQLAPIRGPDLAQFFAPPAPPPTPMYTPAVEPRPVVDPRPVSGVTPFPGPTLSDPKGPGGTTGAIPPGGIADIAAPAVTGVFNPSLVTPDVTFNPNRPRNLLDRPVKFFFNR